MLEKQGFLVDLSTLLMFIFSAFQRNYNSIFISDSDGANNQIKL